MRLLLCFLWIFLCNVSNYGQQKKIRIDAHIHLYDTNREGSYTFLNNKKKGG